MKDWTKLTVETWSLIVEKWLYLAWDYFEINIAKKVPKTVKCQYSLADSKAQTSRPT